MFSKNTLIENLIKKAKADTEVLAAFLFGSAARKDSSRNSDIDICLVMNNGLHIKNTLSQKRLDYLQEFELDIQIFQQLPLYIQIRIIREGKLLFCKNEDALYELVFKTIQDFSDYKHIYRDYLKEVAGVR